MREGTGQKQTSPKNFFFQMLALSFDLCGKMAVGKDQGGDRCRYIMVACYTFLASVDGKPLIDHPGAPSVDKDQPLPSMDLYGGGGLDSKNDQPLPSMDLHGGGDRVSQGEFQMMEFWMKMK